MTQSYSSLHYDHVIVGGSLEALEFAHRTGLPILSIGQPPPAIFFFKSERWRHLSFMLSMTGQLPFADNISKLRINDDKTISCFTNNSRIVEVSFEVAYIVDDHNIAGLPLPIESAKKEFLVLDWVSVRRGGNHPYDYIEDEDSNFVNKLVFYPSRRVMGKRATIKDACSISVLTDKQLRDVEYSETYVFLKSRDMMKTAGIRGTKNGTQAISGKPAYLSLKLEVAERDVFPMHKNVYENTDSLHFDFELYNEPKSVYNRKLERLLVDGREEPRRR